MIERLKTSWLELALKYSEDESLINNLWAEIKNSYSKKNRFYHNLLHIDYLLEQANILKGKIIEYDNLLFAIWYHDIIYKSTKKDNEEQSGFKAKSRLESLHIAEQDIQRIQKLIVSTKKHEVLLSQNNDNAYFLDMDMSILGTDWNTYFNYLSNIRKEYSIFPTFMYNKGRKKVLEHFLERDKIYFTEFFQHKYETKARENLNKEIELLKSKKQL